MLAEAQPNAAHLALADRTASYLACGHREAFEQVVALALASGAKLAIVNRGPTSYDGRSDLKIDAAAGETLRAVVATLPPA